MTGQGNGRSALARRKREGETRGAAGLPGLRARLLSLAALALLTAGGAFAQAIDPRVLQQIQEQLGAAGAAQRAAEAAPGDRARDGPAEAAPVPGGRVDTPEEQRLRREKARAELDALYRPTPVEEDYRRRTGDPDLRQFGYEFFQSGPPPTGSVTGALGDDYILGIGDEVTVSFRGATNETRTSRVDRDGRLLIGSLRPIPAAGRTVGAVRAQIAAETRATMLATEAFVSVGEVRAISVFVGGEVERPGQYSLTSLADISAAIAAAGGVRRSGSLRNVRLVRAGGGTVAVDLYGLLGIGAPPNIRLRDGDRIIVPVLGPTVAVTGAVTRPGIYELRGPASVGAVLAFAGGPVRQRGVDVEIGRVGPSGEERYVRAASLGVRALAGDVLLVLGASPGGALAVVRLDGHVDNPGVRSLASARTVADLLRAPELLKPDTYRLLAVLIRRDRATGARRFEGVDLEREFAGLRTALQSDDTLVVLSQADIDALDPQGQLGRAGTPEEIRRARRPEQARRPADAAQARAPSGGEQPEPATADREPGDVFDRYPGLRDWLRERLVFVTGAVRRAGGFPVAGSLSASRILAAAEGLADDVFDLELDITRYPAGTSERVPVGVNLDAIGRVRLNPGDSIRFAALRSELEAGVVTLEGEVNRPGTFRIRRGERLSELLARAGGLTAQAYPYGTVFTRQSVRESLELSFRRAARELNSGLIALAARTSERGLEGLSGALGLIQLLASAEVPGRVVVEADPRVLALRPDLDTILEPGDTIVVPKRPNFVLVVGDVQNPGAQQFVAGKPALSYVRAAGGFAQTADAGRSFLVLPDGTAQPLRRARGTPPPPGSTIIVPRNLDPGYRLSVIRDVTTIIAQLATSVATVAVLATR